MSQFWSQLVHTLTPYVPGEQPKGDRLIKLNTNENPYPPSAAVQQAIQDQLATDKLRLYPDPNADRLKSALATHFQLDKQQVFVGNGSDEVLAHAFQALLKQDQAILFPDISYSFYPVYCGLYQVDYEAIPLDADLSINPADYQRPNGGIIFPNPNAPTGRLLTLDAIETILKHNTDSVVVVDEAYIDFGGISASCLINQYPNLLVVQTFSKSRSLAGLRVGYALGHSDLIEALERVKNSFNSYPLDQLAIVGAVAALEDQSYFETCCQQVIKTRQTLTEFLHQQGFEVLPSAANFVFATHPHYDAATLAKQLRDESIIVRYFNKPRIDQFLRITIGTDAQNNRLCEVIAELMAST